jgi:hypothetical protein
MMQLNASHAACAWWREPVLLGRAFEVTSGLTAVTEL